MGGPSSATTPKRGSLTHDGAASNAASYPQDSPGSVDVPSGGLDFLCAALDSLVVLYPGTGTDCSCLGIVVGLDTCG